MLAPSITSETLQQSAIAELAAHARIDPKTTAALLTLVPDIAANPMLHDAAVRIAARLVNGTPELGLALLSALQVEEVLGSRATLFYLLIALLEIPAAENQHRIRGVDASISRATWADLRVWCLDLHKNDRSRLGITLQALTWCQQALTGRLFRVGCLQFELEGFDGPLRAYRHRETGELTLIAIPGVNFSEGGRMMASEPGPDAWTAVGTLKPGAIEGHRINPVVGNASREIVSLSPETWELALCEADPMLRVHIPADARLTVLDFLNSADEAIKLFARLDPDKAPKGAFGNGWLWDPQLRTLLPRSWALDEIRALCSLYPSWITEESTLRRLFGPSATRASVLALPLTGLHPLQLAVRQFLSVPENALCARGLFVLMDSGRQLIDEARQRYKKGTRNENTRQNV